MIERRDVIALLIAIGITAATVLGIVYLVQEWWPLLPPAIAVIGFILLAVVVIGYPIYALARWSNRYLAQLKKTKSDEAATPPCAGPDRNRP